MDFGGFIRAFPGFSSPVIPYLQDYQWHTASFALGIAVHLTLFRRGEWDLATGSILKVYSLLLPVLVASLLFISGDVSASGIGNALLTGSSLLAVHVLALGLSISLYRLCFHRLRNFPGPPLAGLSSLYLLVGSLGKHQSEILEDYHRCYGDYVRVCPNKLSITDPAAIMAIYGRLSPVTKGPFTNTSPRANLNNTRDKTEHARRRKFWDRAFSTSALRSRAPIINKHARRLLAQLQTRAGQGLELTSWLALFSFDVLFDIGFGNDKQSIDRGRGDFYMTFAQQTLHIIGLVMHVPWILYFTSWSPTLSARFGRFGQYSAELVKERLESPTDRGDLFSDIIQSYHELTNKSPHDFQNLVGDADLLILAGADSVAAIIASIIYELAVNPDEQEKLRQSLADIDDFEEYQVRGHRQMDAVIHETLRLSPAAPGGHERITPAEGLRIGDRVIPGNTSVFIPHYALFRDARFFEQPSTFIPDRWTDRPELVKDSSAFIPFQLGRNACIGRLLALMEMRTVIHMILSKFRIEPASANMRAEFVDGRDDRWLLATGSLNVVLHDLKGE